MPEPTDPARRVLAVTDLSAAGDAAVTEAQRQARALDAKLYVVHAIPHLDAVRPLFPQRHVDEVVIAAELPRLAEAALRARLSALDVDAAAEILIERGATADGAMKAIERVQPMLVVVGSPDEMVDVTRIVRHATTPILVARPSPQTGVVVAGTDFSDPSLPAIRAAADATARMTGRLVVAHAIELGSLSIYSVDFPAMYSLTAPNELHDAAQRRLDQALTKLAITAKTTISLAAPSAALCEVARVEQAQLLVVATHGRTGLTRFVLGSVAESVIHRAPCSVLVVRAH